MTHDPRDVETVARLLCVSAGVDPDRIPSSATTVKEWQYEQHAAIRFLDALQAKGWKITAQPFECPLPAYDTDPQPERCPLCHAHIDRDACRIDHMARDLPICPRGTP